MSPASDSARNAARRGIALALVLALLAVVGAFGAIAFILTRGASREVDALSGHMRAIAVGEVAYATVVGRLNSTPWTDRWFRDAAELRTDVPAAGGTYTLLLRDAPVPARSDDPTDQLTLFGPRQAELLVRATYERSTVVLYWRLLVPEGSLDGVSRVVPSFFLFAPEGTRLSPVDLDPISGMVNDQLRKRALNRRPFEAKRPPLDRARTADEIGRILGVNPRVPVIDELAPLGQGPARPNPPYIDEVATTTVSPSPIPSPPVPTPPPPPVLPSPPPPTGPTPPTGLPLPPASSPITAATLDANLTVLEGWVTSIRGCLAQAHANPPVPPGIASLDFDLESASSAAATARGLMPGAYNDAAVLGQAFDRYHAGEMAMSAIIRSIHTILPNLTCAGL